METWFLYLIKSSALLTVFFLAYYLLLRKETFFNSNRWFLLGGLLAAIVLPTLTFTHIVWTEPVVESPMAYELTALDVMTAVSPAKDTNATNWLYIAILIYCSGMLFFLVRFIRDSWALFIVLQRNPFQQSGPFRLIDTPGVPSPFSFFNYIVFNTALFPTQELDNIIVHEKVHSRQYHSVDMIFAQLCCIVFWCNPLVWLYKKAIAQNLEFIADAIAIKMISDAIAYQKTLLKVSTAHLCIPITNHFYQSLIKKRIVMLNQQKSNKARSWKYALVLPALVAFMLQFQVKVVAQEKENALTTVSYSNAPVAAETIYDSWSISKDKTDKELKDYAESIKKEHGIVLRFSNIKRNDQGEINAITIQYDTKKGETGTLKYGKGNKEFKGILIVFNQDNNEPHLSFVNMVDGKDPNTLTQAFTLVSTSMANTQDTIGNRASNGLPLTKSTQAKLKIESIKDLATDGKKPALILDGKLQPDSEAAFKALKPTDIKSITILKSDENLKKYGVKELFIVTTENKSPEENSNYGWTYDSYNENGTEYLVVINGIQQTKGTKVKLPLDQEITSHKKLNPEEAENKYGKEGSNGAVEITTGPEKKATPDNGTSLSSKNKDDANQKLTLRYSSTYKTTLQDIMTSTTTDYRKAAIFIDGKESTPKELEQLNPKDVEESSRYKSSESLGKKYGPKAPYGVILITTKKAKKEGRTGLLRLKTDNLKPEVAQLQIDKKTYFEWYKAATQLKHSLTLKAPYENLRLQKNSTAVQKSVIF